MVVFFLFLEKKKMPRKNTWNGSAKAGGGEVGTKSERELEGKCCNPSLGLATKARACKVVGQKWARESHFLIPGMQKSVRERTLTLPSELPRWELESRWTFKCLESDCKGQNSMAWRVLHTIRKLLKHRCLKWARISHLDIWNTNYGQKKGRKSNWQFDFWPLKVKNHPDFLACRWHATYHWKALDDKYNFALNLISIRGLHTKLWGPKITGISTLAILGLPFGSPGTKSHLDVGLVERHNVYYKGEGGGFPQVQAMVNLVSSSCKWIVLAPKVFQLCINHLVLVLCRSIWVNEVCQSS
jgi:hypothetical protein